MAKKSSDVKYKGLSDYRRSGLNNNFGGHVLRKYGGNGALILLEGKRMAKKAKKTKGDVD